MKIQSLAPVGITRLAVAAVATSLAATSIATAQLQITEIMYDALDDSQWEWIEVRNTGDSNFDLDGAFVSEVGAFYRTSFSPQVASGVSQETVIPAGGTAVLWDGFFTPDYTGNQDNALFKAAWNIPESTTVIGTQFWNSLSNGGDEVSIWASRADYEADVVFDPEMPTDGEVGSNANALVTVTFDDASPWPSPSNGESIYWNGNGGSNGFKQGGNWQVSADGVDGAETSVEAMGPPFPAADLANPGLGWDGAFGESSNVSTAPSTGPGSDSLLITEVLYDSGIAEPGFEWVEVYNNDANGDGSALDLSDAVFADRNRAPEAGNIPAGSSIPNGEFAILYNPATTEAEFENTWGTGLNLIPVTDWPSLNNGGDEIGIWPDIVAMTSELNNAGDEMDEGTFANALASLAYTDDDPFPDSNNSASIHLFDFSADPSLGSSWALSGIDGDPFEGEFTEFTAANNFEGFSFGAQPQPGDIVINAGGDVGSPGAIPAVVGDYNGNGFHDPGDYTLWRDAFEAGATTLTNRDPNESGAVNVNDYLAWKNGYIGFVAPPAAAAAPEPTGIALLALGLLAVSASRRR